MYTTKQFLATKILIQVGDNEDTRTHARVLSYSDTATRYVHLQRIF